MTSNIVVEARTRSIDLLAECSTPDGFVASSRFDHYRSIWARDACISGLGALTSGDRDLVSAVRATLTTLSDSTTELGHVPAVVRPSRNEWDWGEGGVVDSGLWFVVLVGEYVRRTGDLDAVREWWPTIERVRSWLSHQDVTGSGLISAAPSTDWMDAALTRAGRTLHLNALYAWASRSFEDVARALGRTVAADADRIVGLVNDWFWPDASIDLRSLYPHGFGHDALRVAYWQAASPYRSHYVSHIVHAALIDVVDVLANLLCVVGGVADHQRSRRVLDALADAGEPFPTRSLMDPVAPGDPTGMLISAAETEIPPRWRNPPGSYHNGAVWPYIGGFHVAAEAVAGRQDRAEALLQDLARCNSIDGWAFPEWIGAGGLGTGARGQAWNAGAYLYAYEAVYPSK